MLHLIKGRAGSGKTHAMRQNNKEKLIEKIAEFFLNVTRMLPLGFIMAS